MRRFFKRLTILVMSFVVFSGSLLTVSCKDKETNEENIDVWSTYNTQKIRKDFHEYDEVKFEPAINLTMAQGEYEGAQLILTPEKDVAYYNASISDLTHTQTGETFSKDRVKIYKQEYMYLADIYQAVDGNTPGYYPDALIPLQAIVDYEENKIAAGDNQGLYFRFSTRPELDEDGNAVVKNVNETEDANRYSYVSSGTYTGTVTLDFGTHTESVPVTLNIVDATVSETAHVKTYFGSWENGFAANLNFSQEGVDQWNESLLEYRLSGTKALNDFVVGDATLDAYVDAIWKYISNPRCSSWKISQSNCTYKYNFDNNYLLQDEYLSKFDVNNQYFRSTFDNEEYAEKYRDRFVKVDGQGNEYAYDPSLENVQAFNVEYFQHQIWMFIAKCLEEDTNVLSKISLGISHIDEPWQHNAHEAVRACATLYKAALVDLAQKLSAEENPSMTVNGKQVTLDFSAKSFTKEEMIQTVLRLRLIVTGDYLETYAGLIDTWCPTSDYYGSEYARENYYGEQAEKWWYPVDDAPGITYTIETSPLYARIPGWMMADYDISGLLYWAFNSYHNEKGLPVEEYFKTNYLRYPKSNGNGYLMYPGGHYELDEMIPSLRLEAIRDGLEEWELFYNVKNTYETISSRIGVAFDASKIIASLGTTLYAQDKIVNDNVAFAAARNSLLQLASCAESSANMCIVDYSDDSYGTQNYKIYVNEGVTISNNGTALTEIYQKIDGVGTIYNLNISLEQSINTMQLRFQSEETEYVYDQLLGGNVSVFEVGQFQATDFMETSDISFNTTQVDCATEGIYSARGGKAIKLEVGASNETNVEDKLQYFKFGCDILKTELKEAKKIIIHLYNASETPIEMAIEYKQSGSFILGKLLTTTLDRGENQLVITLPTGDWENNYIEYLDFCVGEGEQAEQTKILYVKDIVIYKV